MSWYERMNQAIDYIESNLCGNIDLEYVAKITFQSITSFQRTFSIVTEMPISEYIRRRRMSIAAIELQNSMTKVIDISVKYGYESPEAFARAFKEIYGMSPSVARKENSLIKFFPRISFQQTIKGDVVMNYNSDGNTVKIVNTYYENMPALRIIGKRYTQEDLDQDMKFGSKWNEWFQNGWFDRLNELEGLGGHESTVVFAIQISNEIAYWIGMFFPEGTRVLEGFDYADISAGVVGICWIHGYKENGELFSQVAHDLCLTKIQKAGNVIKMDFDGEPCKWSFERYHNERFNMCDNDGKVVLDYGIYLVESEVNERKFVVEDKEEQKLLSLANDSFQEIVPEILISTTIPYSIDLESNLFVCALTMLFLKLEGYAEDTPYICERKQNVCNNCGECGEKSKKSNLAKYHLNLYQNLMTATGLSLMWGDSNEAGVYDLKYIKGIRLPLMEDRLDFAMKLKGFEYICINKTKREGEIFQIIKESIRRDMPVLIKLGDGAEWCVVTGVNEKINAIYGLDAKNYYNSKDKAIAKRTYTKDGLFIITDWMKDLRKAVVITGKTNSIIDFDSLLQRMTERLVSPERRMIEDVIPQMIDSITADNAHGVADYLNQITRCVIGARWHAAEFFNSTLKKRTDNKTTQASLSECAGIYYDTHDICWQIWGQLGVGPHTGYELPNLINQMMFDRERQEKLKCLFAKILNNDAIITEKLQEILNRKQST